MAENLPGRRNDIDATFYSLQLIHRAQTEVFGEVVPDEFITEDSVTQHEGALTVTESQISDLGSYLTSVVAANVDAEGSTDGWVLTSDGAGNAVWEAVGAGSESNDLTAAVVWANVPDANITESSVVQHEAALTIVEGQITGAQFTNWNTAYGWGDHSGLYEPADANIAKVNATETISATWTFTATPRFPNVYGDDDTANLTIFGGIGTGANIELYGGSHATLADRAYYDADIHTFRLAAGTPTKAVIDTSGLNVTGNITLTGTVDGRDVATDGTKLDGIEATADVTDATNVAAAGGLIGTNNLSDLDNAATARANLGDVIQEYMYPIWAEENSGLGNTTYEWAFGNGANTPSNAGIAIYVPSGWTAEIVAMTATTNNASGTSVIEADINGTLQGANCNVTLAGRSGTNDSFTPVALSNGDRLTFRTTTAGTNTAPSTVTAWIKMTLT